MGVRRWSVAVGIVATVALGSVVAVPSGTAYAVDVNVLPPLAYLPSDTALANMTPKAVNTFVQTAGTTVVPNPVTTGPAAPRVGASPPGSPVGTGAAVIGLTLGWQIGTGIVNVVGLPTSGDFACDLQTALGNNACALGPSPEYVINSDVPADTQGWIGVPSAAVALNGGLGDVGVTIVESNSTAVSGQPGVVAFRFMYDLPLMSRVQACNNNPVSSAVLQHTGTPNNGQNIVLRQLYWPNVCTAGSSPVQGGSWSLSTTSTGPVTFTSGGGIVATWYPKGDPLRPPDVDPNPQRWYTTTWRCEAGGLGSADSAIFREGDASWPAFPSASCAATGDRVVQLTVTLHTTGLDDVVVFSWEPTPGSDPTPGTCAGGGCLLQLWRYSSPQAQINCHQNPTACLDWAKDPAAPDNYRCTYGAAKTFKAADVVSLSECGVYTGAFPGPETNRPPEYCTPSGVCDDTPPPPGPGPGDPDGPDEPDNDCPPPFTLMTAFNPWYYYKAFVCGLSDMFVPKAAAVAGATTVVSTAFDQSAIGDLRSSWEDLASLDLSGSCGVIATTEVAAFQGQSLTINTCGQPWNSFGTVRTLLGIGFLLAATWGAVRMVLRSFGIAAADAADDARSSGK